MDGRGQRRRAHARRPLDAPELERWPNSTTSSISPCNLGAHIETLSKAGYVAVEKAFVGKKPQTTVTATATGRGAFARHVAYLKEIIEAGAGQP
jgi:hypothetical protein